MPHPDAAAADMAETLMRIDRKMETSGQQAVTVFLSREARVVIPEGG